MHVVEVHDVGLELLAQSLEISLGLRRINEGNAVADRRERILDIVVLTLCDKVPVPFARQVVRVLHREIGDLVPHALEFGPYGEVVGLGPTFSVMELVHQKDLHRASPS